MLNEAMRLAPDNAAVESDRALSLTEAGRLEEAIRAAERAVRLDQGAATPHFTLGVVLLKAGRLAESVAAFEEGMRLDPEYLARFPRALEAFEECRSRSQR